MKQFIHNILSHVKREQVREKLAKDVTKDVGYDENGFYPLASVFWVGTDYTLNVQSIKKNLSLLFIQMIEILKLSLHMMKTNNVINLFHNLNYETLGLET